MVDIWDLGRYVEEHPDEYEQRWRLAKKLYLACEYRLALEHLQILKNEWSRKLNIVRYLAAAYYRLGRYEEAVDELREAVTVWPDEVGLREQLARVLEVAGRPEEAARVWEQVSLIDPDHPIAHRAAERLLSPQDDSPEEELKITESDSGIDLAPKLICPNCGAQNSAEFDRCWQCHSSFVGEPASGPAPRPALRPAPRVETEGPQTRRAFTIIAGLVLIAVVAYGVVVGLSELPSGEPAPGIVVPQTVYEALFDGLFQARLVLGLVLLVVWPIVLFIPLRWVPSDQPNPLLIVLTGLVLAGLAFGALWTPVELTGRMAALIAVASFLLIFVVFGLSLRDTVIVWIVQGLVVAAALAVALAAVEGPRPLIEARAIVAYAGAHDAPAEPQYRFEAPPAQISSQHDVQWESTGSLWLDRKLSAIQVEVQHQAPGPPLSLSLRQAGNAELFEQFSDSPHRAQHAIEAGKPYEIIVRGDPAQKGAPVQVVVYSLLKPRFGAPQ